MSESRTYHTKQQQSILEIMEKMEEKYVTAGEVLQALKEEGAQVGLTTVYRRLDRLVKEGLVQKIVLDGNSGACYQYVGGKEETSHFLLK
ncbi:MAG: transcriptional repressor, partial [Lachnospiraceae bacterium]|nr:transcriptional repressor [Lachnospiraceae bacterium]